MLNNFFDLTLKQATLSTTGGSEIDVNKYIGLISTIIQFSTSKDTDLKSYFDKIDETEAGICNSSSKQILNNNQEEDENKGKIKGILMLEDIFEFCELLKNSERPSISFDLSRKWSIIYCLYNNSWWYEDNN